jgi:hypothetical protein
LRFFDKQESLDPFAENSSTPVTQRRFYYQYLDDREIAIRHFQEHEWFQIDDYKYLLHYRFQFQPNRIESEHTLIASDGTIEVIQGVDYVLTLDEMEGIFQQAGLRLTNVYSTPKKRPFKMGDNKAYLVVEKA